jgi:hypothetical protein
MYHQIRHKFIFFFASCRALTVLQRFRGIQKISIFDPFKEETHEKIRKIEISQI